ncbi:MAG TPA: hypothetical protein ENO22_12410 [candidate division Zixibacteria bacterium]|nr:hypothetical protein [candidate division Zixibacteria bacterium]HER00133.1 hypothetical protein [candidate division Zixibacteria bacterium]
MRKLWDIHRLPPEQLEKHQLEKLNDLLNHVYHNVEYYNKIMSGSGLLKKDEIKRLMESGYRVEYEFINDIETTGTGKVQPVISEIA